MEIPSPSGNSAARPFQSCFEPPDSRMTGASLCQGSPFTVRNALKEVKYPGYSRDIVSFGLVKDVAAGNGAVTVVVPSRLSRCWITCSTA